MGDFAGPMADLNQAIKLNPGHGFALGERDALERKLSSERRVRSRL